MKILTDIIHSITPNSLKMYAIKPEDDPQYQNYPYKIYRADLFGVLEPKNSWMTDHRYNPIEAAFEIAKCLHSGRKVFILQNKDKDPAVEDWKNQLLQTLNKDSEWWEKYTIKSSETTKFKKTKMTGGPFRHKKYDYYDEIIPTSSLN